MDVAAAFREGIDRAGRPTALALFVGFVVVEVASVIARQSLLAASIATFTATGGDPGTLPFPVEDLQPVELAVTESYPLALLAVLAFAVAHEYLAIVGLRVFAAGESPREAATRRIGRAVIAGAIAGIVARVAVLLGLIALVLPGLFLATALLFAHARVAVADEGPIAALRRSWQLTAGRRLAVGRVVAVLAVLYLAPRLASGFVTGAPGLVLGGVLVGVVAVPSVAVVAGAYVRLMDEGGLEGGRDDPEGGRDEDDEEDDPYARPLGPDDLPEPD